MDFGADDEDANDLYMYGEIIHVCVPPSIAYNTPTPERLNPPGLSVSVPGIRPQPFNAGVKVSQTSRRT